MPAVASPTGTATAVQVSPSPSPAWPAATAGIFTVPADGSSPPTKLADYGFVAGWSPDGALIAFTMLHPDQTGCGVTPAACFSMIFLVRADGTEEPTKLADGNAPAWAPGTNRLLFYTLTRGELTTWQGDTYPAIVGRDVYVADLASGRTIALASNRSTESVSSGGVSSWSPDGSHVLLGWGNLYMVKADGSEPPLKIADGSTFELDWSPDGQRIVYSWGGYIYTVPADGSEPPRKLAIGHQPYWSPDGSRIAFIAKTLPTSEIWLLDPETGETSKLVDGRLPYFSPKSVWSPDGTLILYRAEESIYVLDPQGSAPPTKLGDGDSASWSPDGQRVAITRTIEPSQGVPGASQLFLVNADGSRLALLLDNLAPWRVTYAWSPDSQRIAFSTYTGPLL
jgi:Tol biopolymer transport system component